MSKHAAAAHALRADPGQWATRQRAAGWTWQQVAFHLWQVTGVAVSAKTVRQWAGRTTNNGETG